MARLHRLEMTAGEVEALQHLLHNSSQPSLDDVKRNTPVPVIIDTDIGSDIDDALALLLALNLPADDILVLGVTTVYGNVHLRSRICNEILKSRVQFTDSEQNIPVISGASQPLSKSSVTWSSGTEGISREFQVIPLDELNQYLTGDRKDDDYAIDNAPRFMWEQTQMRPQQVTIVCLGCLTNLANAIDLFPDIVNTVGRVVFMGVGSRLHHDVPSKLKQEYFDLPDKNEEAIHAGKVYSYYPNHNIKCDIPSAVIVFNSEIPITIVSNAATVSVWWEGEATQTILACADKDPSVVGELKTVGLLLEEWLEYRSGVFNTRIKGTCPHDTLTLAEAIYPGKFVKFSTGTLIIHENHGFSSFVLSSEGRHQISTATKDPTVFLSFFNEHILSNIS